MSEGKQPDRKRRTYKFDLIGELLSNYGDMTGGNIVLEIFSYLDFSTFQRGLLVANSWNHFLARSTPIANWKGWKISPTSAIPVVTTFLSRMTLLVKKSRKKFEGKSRKKKIRLWWASKEKWKIWKWLYFIPKYRSLGTDQGKTRFCVKLGITSWMN